MANAADYQNEAQNLYRSLTLGSKIVEKILSEGMSDPALLGRMIIDAYMENRVATTEKILKHLRLLPSRDKFNTQILAWASTKMFA
jgi:hypothetical protein